MHSKAGS